MKIHLYKTQCENLKQKLQPKIQAPKNLQLKLGMKTTQSWLMKTTIEFHVENVEENLLRIESKNMKQLVQKQAKNELFLLWLSIEHQMR